MDQQRWANAQYLWPEWLDTVDIPREINEEVLKEKVLNIFDKLGCHISPNHIESCHCISKKKSDTVTLKFPRQKDYQQVWQVKQERKEIEHENGRL